MNWEALFNVALVQVAAATKDVQEAKVKEWATLLAALIKSSDTSIDDTLVKAVLLPNLDTFVAQLKADLA